ncbi:unnamed protein product [Heligmosomoides polygyrus]|uniref:LHH domain-containing protein n=1 Tax=Heligmosomoides polygyrus TaxID=6339 RepID=A0A183F5W9_HELPZ|nr:unnamed protein product [Heligmosomoides polygyrus]
MISIIPMGLIAQARKAEYDVESLEVLPNGGGKADAAFHVSDEKGKEILVKTNALDNLGEQVSLTPQETSGQEETAKQDSKPGSRSSHDKRLGPSSYHERRRRNWAMGNREVERRGTEIRSKKEKGHLEFVNRDEWFKETKLGELKGIQLPGAFSGGPFGTLWNTVHIYPHRHRYGIEDEVLERRSRLR